MPRRKTINAIPRGELDNDSMASHRSSSRRERVLDFAPGLDGRQPSHGQSFGEWVQVRRRDRWAPQYPSLLPDFPEPPILPALLIIRKSRPSLIPLASVQPVNRFLDLTGNRNCSDVTGFA